MSATRIDILGISFSIQSDERPEYLAKVIDFYRGKIEETRRSLPHTDSLKLSIITALLIVDELFKQKANSSGSISTSEAEEVVAIAQRLIKAIDDRLEEESSGSPHSRA